MTTVSGRGTNVARSQLHRLGHKDLSPEEESCPRAFVPGKAPTALSAAFVIKICIEDLQFACRKRYL
jgi:hypothetical protein